MLAARADAAPEPKETTPINDDIDYEEMRVLVDMGSEKDEMLGVMSKAEAIAAAKERELDLVLIATQEEPVVCKIVNFKKYRFAQEKKKKENKKVASKSKSVLKELKMSYKIGAHDYDVRKKQAVRFLTTGDKVKFSMMFKGREVTHTDVGKDVLMKMAGDLEDCGVLDSTPKLVGRNMIMMISPKPKG
jgi:translation initiation factor IF-3